MVGQFFAPWVVSDNRRRVLTGIFGHFCVASQSGFRSTKQGFYSVLEQAPTSITNASLYQLSYSGIRLKLQRKIAGFALLTSVDNNRTDDLFFLSHRRDKRAAATPVSRQPAPESQWLTRWPSLANPPLRARRRRNGRCGDAAQPDSARSWRLEESNELRSCCR